MTVPKEAPGVGDFLSRLAALPTAVKVLLAVAALIVLGGLN